MPEIVNEPQALPSGTAQSADCRVNEVLWVLVKVALCDTTPE